MKQFLFLFLFIIIGLLFIPKDGLYFTFEEKLESHNLFINHEEVTQSFDTLIINHPSIVYDNTNIGTFETVSVKLNGFYNDLTFDSFHPSDVFFPLFPGSVSTIRVEHSLWHPYLLSFKGDGDIGTFSGVIDCDTKKIHLEILPTIRGAWRFRHWLATLKKTEKGYFYESVYE
jgi:hypothetical protein